MKFVNVLHHNSAIIADHWKFITKVTLYVISSFCFYHWSFPWIVHSVQETSNFPRRLTQFDNTADNADITQSLAANHHRLLSLMTLGLVECRKKTSCAQIAKHFEPNTVLCAFHTIQQYGWLHGIVVERQSLAGVLSLSCAQPVAYG